MTLRERLPRAVGLVMLPLSVVPFTMARDHVLHDDVVAYAAGRARPLGFALPHRCRPRRSTRPCARRSPSAAARA